MARDQNYLERGVYLASMVAEEKVKCNICGGILFDAIQIKQHTSTSSHEYNRSKLEQDLEAVRTKSYQNNISVIMSWKKTSEQELLDSKHMRQPWDFTAFEEEACRLVVTLSSSFSINLYKLISSNLVLFHPSCRQSLNGIFVTKLQRKISLILQNHFIRIFFR